MSQVSVVAQSEEASAVPAPYSRFLSRAPSEPSNHFIRLVRSVDITHPSGKEEIILNWLLTGPTHCVGQIAFIVSPQHSVDVEYVAHAAKRLIYAVPKELRAQGATGPLSP